MTPIKPPISDETQLALRLYEQYGKPLEDEHRGEYVAVTADGKTILGPDLDELTERAIAELGPGNFIFKVGDIAVGKWLWLTSTR